jgi:putative aldouronate transport system substrate-binding protein
VLLCAAIILFMPFALSSPQILDNEKARLMQDDTEAKLSVSLASGDVPDVMRLDQTQFLYMQQSGALRPLNDAYDKWIYPGIKKMNEDLDNKMLDECTFDGNLYAIPRGEDNSSQANLLWIRQDWLEALNLEAPKTLDDVLTIMRAFTNDDPDGNGEKDTYGLSLRSEAYGDLMGCYGVYEAFGAYPDRWIQDEDGKIVNGGVIDEAKEALDWLRSAYAEGLIDPEFATLNIEQMIADVASGKIGMIYAPWYVYDNWITNSLRNDEDCIWLPYEAPGLTADKTADPIVKERMSYEYDVVTVGAPDYAEEAYMKMCNLVFDYYFSATFPEGASTFDYAADGNTTANPDFKANYVWHWTPALIWNATANPNNVTNYSNFYKTGEIAPAIMKMTEERLNAMREYWLQDPSERTRDDSVYSDWTSALQYLYHYALPDESSYALCMKYVHDEGHTRVSVDYGEETETGKAYGSSIKDYVTEYYCRYIMGTADDWETFVAGWNAMGGEQWTNEINEAYTAIHPEN